jgi:multidrug efflux pump subunit AcrB
VPGFLFRPLAEAVVFAMLASYFLSRTIVPTLVMYFFLAERKRDAARAKGAPARVLSPFPPGFEEGFDRMRERYVRSLEWCLASSSAVRALFLAFCGATMALLPILGTDLFPDRGCRADSPAFARADRNTRRGNAALCDRVEQSLRRQIPTDDLSAFIDNIGFPNSGINLTLGNSGVIGTSDAEILISLKPDHRTKPVDYIRELRQTLPREFPGTDFYFQPADIVSQVLNFGLPAPIDVQLTGPNVAENYDLARALLPRLQAVPGAVDVHIQQAYDQPQLNITVDRTKAQRSG